MVTTRAMRARAPVVVAEAEEKKDDGDFSYSAGENKDLPQPQSITPAKERSDEKKDDDSAVNDAIISTSQENDSIPTTAADTNEIPATDPKKKSPLLLLVCATGITSCYLWYGTIQEHIFHMDAADAANNEEDEEESITLFLLATGTFSAFLLALIWTLIGPILLPKKSENSNESKHHGSDQAPSSTSGGGRLNHPLIVLTSITYLSAMAASNESLLYVSYPTCVLAKSSKLIPTMIVGYLVDKWRSFRNQNKNGSISNGNGGSSHAAHSKSINAMEWIGAALITIGILSFQYIQLHKQSTSTNGGGHGHGDKEEKPDSPYGLALLGFSLFMDGLLGACQSTLKRKEDATTTAKTIISAYKPPSAMETMLYINLYATLILLPASYYLGQFQRGLSVMLSSKATLLLQLNLSASLGQVFIFLTIHHFSPLTCTTITTTRKFFTILLSVYKFGHVLETSQWASIGLVFGGLYLEIVAKLFEQHDSTVVKTADVEKKKKD